MGGSVAVTLREANGTVHRMCRWTNVLPWFICNPDFYEKKRQHIRDYLDEWYEMCQEYAEDPSQGMVSCYVPHPFLAPHAYGLVVLDLQQNLILTCQNYMSPGKLGVPRSDEDRVRHAGRLSKAQRVKAISIWPRDKKEKMVMLEAPPGPFQLAEYLDEHDASMSTLSLRTDPFTVESFEENDAQGTMALWRRVRTLGFALSEEEEILWAETVIEQRKNALLHFAVQYPDYERIDWTGQGLLLYRDAGGEPYTVADAKRDSEATKDTKLYYSILATQESLRGGCAMTYKQPHVFPGEDDTVEMESAIELTT